MKCEECGYDYGTLPRDELAVTLRALAERYGEGLEASPEVLRKHALAGVWSILEYCCHLRDVLRAQRERIGLALEQDTPTFAPMRREERVSEERYNEQEPKRVANEIQEAADQLAARLESLDEAGWNRAGVYNYPRSEVRTVDWIGRHTVHECVHHLMDIDRLVRAASRESR
ncbi:MAG: DinB family protein [Actinomycetota bacterium]